MSRYFSAAMAPSTPLPPGWNDPYYGTGNADGTSTVDLSAIGAGFLNGGTDGATKPPMDDKTKALIAGGLLLALGVVVYASKSRRRRSRR